MIRRSSKPTSVVRRALLGGLILMSAISLSGCRWLPAPNLRGESFSEEDQRLTEGYRPPDVGNSPHSFSTKGRQIEQNLGVSK
jgi:hypothetical protein